ncbi:MAG: efflux RND transporter periplasmic adaptor subunit [Burkholderiaceae bacterium]
MLPALAALGIGLLLSACGPKEGGAGAAKGPGGPPGGGMPPPEVGVVTVEPKPVMLQIELPGRVSPLRVAQVRARVNGVVLKRLFREGSEVKAGQVLYQIDAASYQAALDSAQASVGRAQAALTQTMAQAERYKPLVEANAVSKQEYINVVAANKQSEADLASAKAAVQAARINLDYATVRAPISGRIGQSLVTEGALVSQAEATQLAVIQQTNVVYVNFTQSSGDLLRLRKALASKQVRGTSQSVTAVHVVLEDDSEYPHPGKLLFADLTVDPTSGQITLRAEVPNAEGVLLPGQYVRVRLAQAEVPDAILLPQQAVTRSNQGDTVLVIGADNKPVTRQVRIGSSLGNNWVVLSGLQAGEQVIVEGFQKMMVPGAPVKPVPWKGPAAQAAAGAAGAPAAAGSAARAPASAAVPAVSAASGK